MSPRRVLLALLGLLLSLSPILGMRVSQELEVLAVADQYRPSTLVVESSHCTMGSANRVWDRDGSSRMVYEHSRCFLEGRVEGSAERLHVGADRVESHRPGDEIAIYYAPALEPFGAAGQNLRLTLQAGGHPRDFARQQLWLWPIGFAFILAYLLALEGVYVWTPRFARWRAGPEGWIAPGEGAAPAFGFAFVAFGLLWIQGDLRNESQGLWIAGIVLVAIGLPFVVRPLVQVDTVAGTTRRCLALGPLQWRRAARPIGDAPRVEVVGPSIDESEPGLIVRGGSETIPLMRSADADGLRRLARELAERLDCGVRDKLAEAERRAASKATGEPLGAARSSRLPALLQTAALVLLPVLLIASVPALHRPLLVQLLSRDVPQLASLQRLSASALSGQDEPEVLHELVLVANTTRGSLQEAALVAIEETAGIESPAPDLRERLRTVNAWAATRLGRTTDGNGGVLAWYPVAEIWRDEIDDIASPDPREAWVAWAGFGPVEFADPAAFLRAVGPALVDPRPLSFAVKRGSFLMGPGPDAPAFEGQPVPLSAHRHHALVSTVGSALALRYWTYDDVGGGEFPEDFEAWWARYAQEHLLPPLPSSDR